ncbi:hypothetical protein KSP40_PGU006535 [Platanthera guangdongensis]|uniref:Uncharacterized protein n=1 Tax=Platanthera guangdongensis TaxID=2320717 RepID=A0ABR2N2I6_9ASPA
MASLISSPAIAPAPPRRRRPSRFLSKPPLHQAEYRPSLIRLSSLHHAPFLLDVSTAVTDAAVAGDGGTTYSPASYYTSLGLFVISVPGLWSLIKRSVKPKVISC